MGMLSEKINPWHTILKAAKSGRKGYDWSLSSFEFLWRAELTSLMQSMENIEELYSSVGNTPTKKSLSVSMLMLFQFNVLFKKKKVLTPPFPTHLRTQ